MIRQKRGKARTDGHLDNRQTELTTWKLFRCGSEDHMNAKFPQPPRYIEERQKQVRSHEKVNRA